MATYGPASADALAVLDEMKQAHHKRLVETEVTILLQAAYGKRDDESGELVSPALKWAGYPAVALARVTSLADRQAGVEDCRIQYDADLWGSWTISQKRALLDHELSHFELVVDDEGNIKGDDLGRPKLKLRPHDAQVGAFFDIIHRHGRDAMEAMGLMDLCERIPKAVYMEEQ